MTDGPADGDPTPDTDSEDDDHESLLERVEDWIEKEPELRDPEDEREVPFVPPPPD